MRTSVASAKPILVVDLDGTLLRSNILFETFWRACGSDFRVSLLCVRTLRQGRARLKRQLAQIGAVDAANLPYDATVLAYVTAWRANGGRTALVTASDERVARGIADHLGLFDEVYGSDGQRNLKGVVKAAFLAERFAECGFAYMGDAEADLPVWERAKKAITVNAPAALRRRVEALATEIEHLGTTSRSVEPYVRALRPHQWLKNVLVFVPMFAAHVFAAATILQSVLAFVAFSLVASSVYILNDLLDLDADRAHPRKRRRPFAAGDVPLAHGTAMIGVLLLAGSLVSLALGWSFLGVMGAYWLATTAYSLHLKRRIVVDICMLAGLYTLRIAGGGVATGIPLSMWLLAFSIFFFLALAAIKRQAELVDAVSRDNLSAGGRGYRVDDLPIISQFAVAGGYVSVLVMALYVNSPAVLELYGEPFALWGICLVILYWISRMVLVAHRGEMHDDPVVYAVKDRVSQVCGVVAGGFAVAGTVL